MSAGRRLGLHVAVLALLGALALAYTWPLAIHIRSHYVARNPAPAPLSVDLLFSSWILASDAHRLVHDPLHLFETNNLHPFRHTLAFGENLVGVALAVLPVQLAWDDPTLTHNVATVLCLVLTGFGAFLLVRELGGGTLAAVVTGGLVVCSPVTWLEIVLLPLLAGYWTPIALFLLVRLVRMRGWGSALLLGGAVALQAWSSLQHGFFLALGLVATVPVLALLSSSARRALLHIVGAGVLAGLLCIPLALPYRAVTWELDTTAREGAPQFSLQPGRLIRPLADPVGYLAERVRSGEHVERIGTLTPWVLVAAGVLASALGRRRLPLDRGALVALAAGGLANFLFALGPLGHPWFPSLYPLVTEMLPGLAWVRVPMRAFLYTHLVLCVLAGTGLAAVLHQLRRPSARLAVAAAVVALIVVEAGWRPIALAPAPERTTPLTPALRALDDRCAIADIPAGGEANGVALFRSTAHWRPLINGFSGFYPIGGAAVVPVLNAFPSRDALALLDGAGSCAVVARRTGDPTFLSRVVADSEALGFAVTRADSEALIRLPPPAAPRPEPALLPRATWTVAPEAGKGGRLVLDGDDETVWRGTTRADYGPDRLTLDLGAPVSVSGLALDLGRRFRLYLHTYRIEGSVDGAAWVTLAESPMALPPLASYRANPLRVRQRIDFPSAVVRWIRVGPYRRPGAADVGWSSWGVAELFAYAG